MNGSASLTTYRSVVTGDFAPPSGTGSLFELKPGGACVRAGLLQSTVYSCTSSILTFWDDCEWSLDGSTLTVVLGEGTLRTRMCGGEVKEGTAKAATLRYTAAISVEEPYTWLTLTEPDGSSTRFRRE